MPYFFVGKNISVAKHIRKLLRENIEYETSIEILLHFFANISIVCSTVAYNSVLHYEWSNKFVLLSLYVCHTTEATIIIWPTLSISTCV